MLRWGALLLLLATCGPSLTGHQAQQNSDEDWRAEAREETRQRALEVKHKCDRDLLDEELTPIGEKLPLNLDSSEVDFSMLANKDTATDAEKEAIAELVARRAQCHRRQSELLGPPPFWMTHQRQRNTAALASLYGGDLTYGDFNRQLQEINAMADKERAEDEYRMQMLAQTQMQTSAAQAQAYQAQRAAQEQERARQDAAYQRAADAFAKAFAPKPTINCTSTANGNSVDTRCQ